MKYKLYLSGGHTKTLKANTPQQAKRKYYSSASHFNTEYSVLKVKPYKPLTKPKRRRTYNPFMLRW